MLLDVQCARIQTYHFCYSSHHIGKISQYMPRPEFHIFNSLHSTNSLGQLCRLGFELSQPRRVAQCQSLSKAFLFKDGIKCYILMFGEKNKLSSGICQKSTEGNLLMYCGFFLWSVEYNPQVTSGFLAAPHGRAW